MLRIAYRPSNAERYVDSSGRPVAEPAAVARRTNTKIVRNDRTIAVISHSADAATLDHEIGRPRSLYRVWGMEDVS